MKCYYHHDRDAVATCTRCGKGLCAECADLFDPCLCIDCFNYAEDAKIMDEAFAKEREERAIIEYRNNAKRQFITLSAIGLFVAFAAYCLMFRVGATGSYKYTTLALLVSFCAPFGWEVLTEASNYFFADREYVVALWFAAFCSILKIVFSFAFGIPCLFFLANRTLFGVGMDEW